RYLPGERPAQGLRSISLVSRCLGDVVPRYATATMPSTCACPSRSRSTGRPDGPVRRPLPLGMATPWRLRILVLLRCLRRRDPGRGPLWHRGLLAGAQLPRPGVLASGLAPASGPWASGLLPTSPRRRSRVPPCPLAPSEGLHEEAPNFRVPPVSAVTTASN